MSEVLIVTLFVCGESALTLNEAELEQLRNSD